MTKVYKLLIPSAVFLSTVFCMETITLAETGISKPAWILWKQMSDFSVEGRLPKERINEWAVERALDSMAACQKILEQIIDVHKKGERHSSVEFTSSIGTNSGVAITSGKDKDGYPWSFTYKYSCIPDTIDPRAPKR